MARVYLTFDDRHINVYMGPSAQKHSIDDFNGGNFDHAGLNFIRGSQISIDTVNLQGGPIGLTTAVPPPGVPSWGARYRDFLAKSFTRHTSMVAQTENLPYADQTIDLDPNVRDAWGLPAPRITYDWRRPNEAARVEYMLAKMEEIGRTMGASQVWRAPRGPGAPGAHHEGGTRMGNDPKSSVVNRYGQSWDIPNLFVVGSSTFPTMSGFNPTLTIQALAYMPFATVHLTIDRMVCKSVFMPLVRCGLFRLRSSPLLDRVCRRTRLARCHPLTALFRTAQTACVQGRSLDHTKRQIPGAFC
jgi:gluconate 2-dehydrogenase alpha chain